VGRSLIFQCILFVRLYTLVSKLNERNIKVSRSAYAAKKDLRLALSTTDDNEIKEIATKILDGLRQRHLLFFGSIGVNKYKWDFYWVLIFREAQTERH
jgi:hypothetical protein